MAYIMNLPGRQRLKIMVRSEHIERAPVVPHERRGKKVAIKQMANSGWQLAKAKSTAK